MNLLSIKKPCHDNGCWFICDDLVFFIQDKVTKVILYQGKNDGDLFTILVIVFSRKFSAAGMNKELQAGLIRKVVKTSIWHKRLGHPFEEVLSAMLKAFNVLV